MTSTHKVTLTDREQFFYDNAGYSYDPATETASSGRTRNAILLAQAESVLLREKWDVTWDIDPDADTEPSDNYFVSGAPHWMCEVKTSDGRTANLCSIDLGHGKYPESEPYARVVEAELASEITGR